MRNLLRSAALAAAAALSLAATAEPPAFEPESIVRRVDRVSLVALVQVGGRLVTAGERGRILVSDDAGVSWKVAATPTHHALTSLYFSDPKTGFATGHQGVLLRTEDGGLSWSQAQVAMTETAALFAVRVQGERGIAVGAYGAYLESSDAGRSWKSRRIMAADFDRHLTGIAVAAQGRMLLAGEAGTLLVSADTGATWQAVRSPYDGSFFGAIGLRNGAVIAFGMRGNAFRSADGGKTWQRVDLGAYKGALQGATELFDGMVVLTGADGLVATSRDGGVSFSTHAIASRVAVAAVVQVTGGRWLAASPSGLRWAD